MRLLGRQPTEGAIERDVALIIVASDGLLPGGKSSFQDLRSDLTEDQLKQFRRDMMKRFPELFSIEETEECRRLLIELVDQNIERCQEMVDEFESKADQTAESSVTELKCDRTPDTYRLLNYINSSRRGLYQGIAAYKKYTKESKKEDDGSPRKARDVPEWVPRRRRVNGDAMPEEVDLAWAYEAGAGSECEVQPCGEKDGIRLREQARVDVMLDTILADGVTDSNDSIDATGDTISKFRNVIGSSKLDTIIGDSNDNVIEGGAQLLVLGEPHPCRALGKIGPRVPQRLWPGQDSISE